MLYNCYVSDSRLRIRIISIRGYNKSNMIQDSEVHEVPCNKKSKLFIVLLHFQSLNVIYVYVYNFIIYYIYKIVLCLILHILNMYIKIYKMLNIHFFIIHRK